MGYMGPQHERSDSNLTAWYLRLTCLNSPVKHQKKKGGADTASTLPTQA